MKRACIILSLILLLFLSACKPNLSDEKIKNDPANAINICTKAPDNEQVNCYMRISEVLRTTDPDAAFQACSSIKDDNPKRGCYEDLFRAQNNTDVKIKLCTQVDLPDIKKGCLEELAREEKDIKKAVALCNEIKDDNNFKEHCLNEIASGSASTDIDANLALCDARTGNSRDQCYQGIGTSLFETQPAKGVEVCNKINDNSIKNNCLNYFMSFPELIKANPSLAIQICDAMTLKDNCYSNVADKLSAIDSKKATEVCKKLSDEIQISNCFGNVWFSLDTRVTSDYDFSISLCNALNLKKDDCFRRVAGAFMNVDKTKAEAACNMIPTSSSSGCLQSLS